MGMFSDVKRPKLVCGKSRTQQNLRDMCSPKRLVEKYGTKRLREALKVNPGLYSDMPTDIDFKRSMDIVARGQSSFEALPSKLRRRFENDPIKLIEFLGDVKNRDEAIELGLITRPAVTDEAERKDVKKAVDDPIKAKKLADVKSAKKADEKDDN